MKCLIVVVATFIATTPAWAAEQRFPVNLSASIETEAGKTDITDQDLVTSPGNRLVLMVDTEDHIVAVEEWNATLTAASTSKTSTTPADAGSPCVGHLQQRAPTSVTFAR